MTTATEAGRAADHRKLEMQQIAIAICGALHEYIPRVCRTDAEMCLIEFLHKHNARVVFDDKAS